jgi:F420-non-reducing hydrogenase iron-sulfur subunit
MRADDQVNEALSDRPILVLATSACAYPGADATGQAHLHYSERAFVVKVPSPVVFPDGFYYRCFEKGVGGIIVMSCGEECPYRGAFHQLAARLDRVSLGLRERGIDPRRLKLCSICTVCTKSFLREVAEMEETLRAGSAGAA